MSTDYQLQILITSAKSFLPYNVIYVQALEMRVWASLGALLSTTTTQITFASKQNRNLLCRGQALCTQEWLPLLGQAWNWFPFWFLNPTHYPIGNSDFLLTTWAPIWEFDSCPQASGVLQSYSTPGTDYLLPPPKISSILVTWPPLCPGLPPESGTNKCHNQTSASILYDLQRDSPLLRLVAEAHEQW